MKIRTTLKLNEVMIAMRLRLGIGQKPGKGKAIGPMVFREGNVTKLGESRKDIDVSGDCGNIAPTDDLAFRPMNQKRNAMPAFID